MTERWNAEATTMAPETAPALTQLEIDQRVFDLYDEYCHGRIDRREFLQRGRRAWRRRPRHGAGAAAALRAGADDLLHRRADQGAAT